MNDRFRDRGRASQTTDLGARKAKETRCRAGGEDRSHTPDTGARQGIGDAGDSNRWVPSRRLVRPSAGPAWPATAGAGGPVRPRGSVQRPSAGARFWHPLPSSSVRQAAHAETRMATMPTPLPAWDAQSGDSADHLRPPHKALSSVRWTAARGWPFRSP